MRARDAIERAQGFIREELWFAKPGSRRGVSRLLGLLQFSVMTAEGFVRDRLLLQASGLSYFTVMSLIPIFAIIVAIAAAIGIDSDLPDKIVANIAAGAPEAQERILEQIRRADFKALGGVAAAIVFVTTVLGLSNIERAFNTIWGVNKPRSLGRRFPDYLAILVVVPLLASGLSLATGLKSQWLLEQLFEFELFSSLYAAGLRYVPWLVLSTAFALMFWFLPNTTVRFSSAALGGVVSGGLVLLAQHVYLHYSVGFAKANALFGAFAQLPLLFMWIYIFWAVVLFGAELAFAHQNLASYRSEIQGHGAVPAESEAVALRVALEVARAFQGAAPAPTADDLADALGAPVRRVRGVLDQLETAEIVSQRGAKVGQEAFQLGRPADQIRVSDILGAVRGEREAHGRDDNGLTVENLLAELDAAAFRGGAGRSLADLLTATSSAATEGGMRSTSRDPSSLDRSSAEG